MNTLKTALIGTILLGACTSTTYVVRQEPAPAVTYVTVDPAVVVMVTRTTGWTEHYVRYYIGRGWTYEEIILGYNYSYYYGVTFEFVFESRHRHRHEHNSWTYVHNEVHNHYYQSGGTPPPPPPPGDPHTAGITGGTDEERERAAMADAVSVDTGVPVEVAEQALAAGYEPGEVLDAAEAGAVDAESMDAYLAENHEEYAAEQEYAEAVSIDEEAAPVEEDWQEEAAPEAPVEEAPSEEDDEDEAPQ